MQVSPTASADHAPTADPGPRLTSASGTDPGPRTCVYTALIGRYERLGEQPVAARSAVPFVCFTDDPELRSDTWQIRHVSPVFGTDPIRSQRDVKLRPQLHLPDFDVSLYIDNSVLLTEPPERLFEGFDQAAGMCAIEHSIRDTVLDEFLEVVRVGLDDQGRVFEQLNHYLIDCPEILSAKPYWGGIMMRDHRSPAVSALGEIWYAHVNRFSRRDQLSFNLALRRAGLEPQVMRVDNEASWFHTWPQSLERNQGGGGGGRALGAWLAPPVARVRMLEQSSAEHAARAASLERSLAEHAAWAASLERSLAEHAAWAKSLERDLAERSVASGALEQALAERTEAVRVLEQEVARQAAWAESLVRDLAERSTANGALEQALAERAEAVRVLEQDLAARTAAQDAAERAAAYNGERYNAVIASTTWRATGAARRLAGRHPRVVRLARRVIWTCFGKVESSR